MHQKVDAGFRNYFVVFKHYFVVFRNHSLYLETPPSYSETTGWFGAGFLYVLLRVGWFRVLTCRNYRHIPRVFNIVKSSKKIGSTRKKKETHGWTKTSVFDALFFLIVFPICFLFLYFFLNLSGFCNFNFSRFQFFFGSISDVSLATSIFLSYVLPM